MKKKNNIIFILLLTLSLVSACAGEMEEENEVVSLKAVVLPYTSFGPFFIAQEEGFFFEQNLNVEFVRFDSGTSPLPLLAQGEIDVLGSGPSIGLFNSIASGTEIRVVADKGYLAADGCTYMALLATDAWSEANPEITADALQSARVSIDPINFEAFMFDKVLNDVGLGMSDIVGNDIAPPALAEAVQNDAVDIISVGDPWIVRLLDTTDLSVWKPYQEIVPNMQFGFVLFGPSLFKDNPDVGERFLAAYLRGIEQYNEGKTERNLEIMSEYTKLDVETLNKACWPPMNASGLINLETVNAYQQWAFENDLLDEVVSPDDYWVPSLVENAAKIVK